MAQWVQHKSGIGEKWEVGARDPSSSDTWMISRPHQFNLFLPKSEYVLCDPPQSRWVDVTAECEPCCGNGLIHGELQLNMPITQSPQSRYRLRKVLLEHGPTATQKYAFVVEKERS